MTENEDIRYDFGGMPDKQNMQYILYFYASLFIAFVIGLAWLLKDYNQGEQLPPDERVESRETKRAYVYQYKMNPIIYAVAAIIVAIALYFVTGQQKKPEAAARRPVARDRVNDAPPPGTAARRRRMDYRARVQQDQRAEDENQSDNDQPERTSPEELDPSGKMGAKKLRKMQEKEERRILREAEVQDRLERKQEQMEREKMAQLEEEKRQIEEEKKAEEEKRIKEEKERQEHEEYLKLKEMFSVDEEGQADVTSEEQSHNLLQEFVIYIKENKVVLLEDLASHFGLRTQQAIDRIHDMLKDEILTGVVDDRGKFIYISPEELKSVAEFVEQRGRFSIAELAQASNSLINLKPETAISLSGAS